MEAVVSDVLESRPRRWTEVWGAVGARVFWAVVKGVLGVVLTIHPLGAVVVVGWTGRLMRRTALKSWWSGTEQPYRKLMSFREAAAHRPGWGGQASWPNWVFGSEPWAEVRRGRLHRVLAGGWENLWLGAALLINTYVVLAVPCLLMATWWYAGWQVSFNKAYEYFSYGALFSLVGMVLFAMAMFYVPMAQARQAVSGEWRTFWQFSLIRRVVRRRWFSCLLLALGYVAAGALVMVVLALPMAAEFQDWFNRLPPEKVDQAIRGYYLLGAVGIFPAYVGLRWVAARIYATAILRMRESGEVREEELSAVERLAFPAGRVAAGQAEAVWSRRSAARSWLISAPFRLVGGVVVFALWMVLVAEVYISQFFVYRGPRVWMSHPLVQLPWTDYSPSSRAEPR